MPKYKKMYNKIIKKYGKKKGEGLYYALERNIMKKNKNTSQKIKGISMDGLTTQQVNAMKRHSQHHSSKHIQSMVKLMKEGKTFTESHTIAKKKVGN
tara:strand:+ start:1919 stop:2209 length:291 start_codon:yes stop_codon:yes gene_type:complete